MASINWRFLFVRRIATQPQNYRGARFNELDAFRGFAALWVVLFHYLYRYDVKYGTNGTALVGSFEYIGGIFGVYLFFMISGFVIFMTIRGVGSWMDFVVSRFSRLYPAYWSAVAVTGAVAWWFPLPGQTVSGGQIIANLTMLQSFFYIPNVDGVYWTLGIELAFYVVMLMLFLSRMLGRIEAVGWIWLGVAMATHLAALLGFHLPYRISLLFILDYAQLFIAGIVFYLVWLAGYSWNRICLLGACLVVEFFAQDGMTVIVIAGFFVAFHFCVMGRLGWVSCGPVLWLGAISYPLYLTHQMIGYRVIATMLQAGVPAPIAIVSVIGGALALATALSVYIERPTMRLIRRYYRRWLTQVRPESAIFRGPV